MESQRQEPARGEKSFTTEVERGAGGHSCQRSHHTDQQSSSRRDPSHSKVQQNRAPFIVATTNIVLTNRLKWALCILLRINAYSAFPIERWRFFASSYRLLVLCGVDRRPRKRGCWPLGFAAFKGNSLSVAPTHDQVSETAVPVPRRSLL